MTHLELEKLKKAVSGEYAAIRRTTRLEPQGDKIFPPTYEGGEYAEETRVVRMENGTTLKIQTVLLDSVQSQANRMELALLRAYDEGRLRMPMLQVNFGDETSESVLREVGRVTALEAPHRMCDAIFRDSLLDGQPFRGSQRGNGLNGAKAANATPVFELCPTALLFGFWDSTGPRGGLGAKLQRSLVSEIVGYESVSGKRPASRIDRVIEKVPQDFKIYSTGSRALTLDPSKARQDEEGKPVVMKASNINHGNITPSLYHEDEKTKKPVLNHGGVTLAYAIQQSVLSLAALRRLRFPLNGNTSPDVDLAARTVLAALGLAAICLLDDDGFDLRSRCLLDGKPGAFEFVGRGETSPFRIESETAIHLLNEAVTQAKDLGLPWPEEPVILSPSPDLSQLVTVSRTRAMAVGAGE